MSYPGVIISVIPGLGKTAAMNDGVSALMAHATAIEGALVLGDPFMVTSLAELEAKGVTEAYDIAGKVLLWHHVKEFYTEAKQGTKLYIMPLAAATKVGDMVDKTKTNASKLLYFAKGEIRLLAVTSMSEAMTTLKANIGKAQELYKWSFDNAMPCSIMIEGRVFPTDYTAALDLRTECAANRVSVVVSQDPTVAVLDAAYAGYANVCLAMGRASAMAVSRNIGRVRSGALIPTAAGFSNGKKDGDVGYYDGGQLAVIDSKGYIFMRSHIGKAGYYFNHDHAACAVTDDCSSLSRGRTIDKAVRIMSAANIEEVLDDVELDPTTGRIAPDIIKDYQQRCYDAIMSQMEDEISGASVYVDAEQDVLATDKLKSRLSIVSHGLTATVEVEVGFTKTIE